MIMISSSSSYSVCYYHDMIISSVVVVLCGWRPGGLRAVRLGQAVDHGRAEGHEDLVISNK